MLDEARSILVEIGRRVDDRVARERRERDELEGAIVSRRDRFAAAAEAAIYDLTDAQLAFICDTSSLVAALCSRRAGKTFAFVRAMVAFALVVPKSRQIYINETRAEAKALVWDEPDDGFLAVLDRLGLTRGERRGDGADYWANETELSLRFANGSVVYLFGATDEKQANKLRGRKVHRVVIDEAQKLPSIESLVKRVLGASIKDLKGQIWLAGTPGIDCGGYFYEVTRGDGKELTGWSVHRWSVRDNPFFGRVVERDGVFDVVDQGGIVIRGDLADRVAAEAAALVERWRATAEAAKAENGWDEDDPDFRREWGGEWVREDSRYVIHVHKVPNHELVFAPLRRTEAGDYDHLASMRDLPAHSSGRAYDWAFALGMDLGFDPDPTAIVLWAFSLELHDIYEMWSWKATRLHNDDRARELRKILDVVPITIGVADAGGQGKELVEDLRVRYALPLVPAEKTHKDARIVTFNTEIRTRRIHFRGQPGLVLSAESVSPLLWEALNLVYSPTVGGDAKPKVHKYRKLPDRSVPGDHCIDGGIYALHHCYNFRAAPETPRPLPGTAEHHQAIEANIEHELDAEIDEQEEYDHGYA